MDKEKRAALRKVAEPVKGWSRCNRAWFDTSEDDPAAVVGHIDEEGNYYPVATIDCDQYYQGQDSLPLAKFYAAANPSTILSLLDYIETLEKDAARLDWMLKNNDASIVSDGAYGPFHVWFRHSNRVAQKAKTERAAIDAAIQGETE